MFQQSVELFEIELAIGILVCFAKVILYLAFEDLLSLLTNLIFVTAMLLVPIICSV